MLRPNTLMTHETSPFFGLIRGLAATLGLALGGLAVGFGVAWAVHGSIE